ERRDCKRVCLRLRPVAEHGLLISRDAGADAQGGPERSLNSPVEGGPMIPVVLFIGGQRDALQTGVGTDGGTVEDDGLALRMRWLSAGTHRKRGRQPSALKRR